jgi:hypothetical protein
VPPAGFEPTAPGLGIPRGNLSSLTSAAPSLQSRGHSPNKLSPNDPRLAGRGHMVDTGPSRPVDLKIVESKARPQDLQSSGVRKPQ